MLKSSLLAFLALALALTAVPVQAQTQPIPNSYRVEGRIASFWRQHGGLPIFGQAISDQRIERDETGVARVQWFERARLELHPDLAAPYDVQLAHLGVLALNQQGRDWRATPPEEPDPGCRFFSETERNLCEPFLSYWRANGLEFDGQPGKSEAESLALFGFPLTIPAFETNSSGQRVLTQWFERARFEYLQNNPRASRVLLGRLGAEQFAPGRQGLDRPLSPPPGYVAVREPGWPAALEIPQGFSLREIASGLIRPRFMAYDPSDGSLVVASDGFDQVLRLIARNDDGRYDRVQVIAEKLRHVHSVAFFEGELYAAAQDRVVRLSDFGPDGHARVVETVLDDLPSGGTDLYNHRTRTLLFGPDDMLYVSIGSSCDACEEDTPLRAAVLRATPNGEDLEIFASGLRNSVGITFHPHTGALWGVDMGRNQLGPYLPPDELNLIEQGKDYGWPYCFGQREPDPGFNDQARCLPTEPTRYDLPAHWAPLGIVFYDGPGFPPTYRNDLLIAFRGSAVDELPDRRVGYRVSRMRFVNNQPIGLEDLVRGFVLDNQAWARPSGLLLLPDGSLIISDDFGGRIFQLRYDGS
ncbi:MAG: PQQ-dependent sugar dehydrogenase [Oscillochloridaceae bacterium umkhey_bin13]